MSALVEIAPTAVLSVEVVGHRPRLAARWAVAPEVHELRATQHAIVAVCWAASGGQPWDVVPFTTSDRYGLVAGAELVLDRTTYSAIREGERALEGVREALL